MECINFLYLVEFVHIYTLPIHSKKVKLFLVLHFKRYKHFLYNSIRQAITLVKYFHI